MKKPSRTQLAAVTTVGFWLLGIAGVIWLLVHHGLEDLRAGLAAAGWRLLAVGAYAVVPLTCHAIGWWVVIPRAFRPTLVRTLRIRWIGTAVNDLLPVAKIGGDLVRVRLIHQSGVPGAWAGASVVAEITAGISTQLLFASLGIVLLLQRPGAEETGRSVALAIGTFAVLIVGFFVAQRAGLFRGAARALERIFQTDGASSLADGAGSLDAAILETYRRPGPFAAAAAWRFAGWVTGAGEVWLALFVLGHPIGLGDALILESLIQFVRNAAFLVPGALGVQEGAFLILGQALGLGPDASLALSLVKRVRELLLGLPALAALASRKGSGWFVNFFLRKKLTNQPDPFLDGAAEDCVGAAPRSVATARRAGFD